MKTHWCARQGYRVGVLWILAKPQWLHQIPLVEG